MPKRFIEALDPRCLLSGSHSVPFLDAADSVAAIHASVHRDAKRAVKKDVPVAQADAATMADIEFDGPIVIKRGGVYSGNWESQDADVPAVSVRTSERVIIENSLIRSRGVGIDAPGGKSNIIVRNSTGYGLNPNVAGRYPGRFLNVEGFTSVVAKNNNLVNTSGIYVSDYRGNHSRAQTVKVLRNIVTNVDGRVSDGNGGWSTDAPDPDEYRQFFQINRVENLAGVEIGWNQVINERGRSRVEESINIHASSGTPKSPILIHDNYIQGAYPANAADAADYAGGGIMVSDNGSSFVRAVKNQIVGIGGVGINISSGHDNSILNNRIVSSGLAPDGKPLPWSNAGAVIWNFNGESTFSENVGAGNLIGWISGEGERNDAWVPDAADWKANKPIAGRIGLATEAAEWNVWRNRLAAGGIAVGPGK